MPEASHKALIKLNDSFKYLAALTRTYNVIKDIQSKEVFIIHEQGVRVVASFLWFSLEIKTNLLRGRRNSISLDPVLMVFLKSATARLRENLTTLGHSDING